MQPFSNRSGQDVEPSTANFSGMRKFTAFTLLVAFFIAQYAVHTSYLECRLANYFKQAGEKCDCEKLWLTAKSPADPSSLPVPHYHIHPDELYYPSFIIIRNTSFTDLNKRYSRYNTTVFPAGIDTGIDHPPQFG